MTIKQLLHGYPRSLGHNHTRNDKVACNLRISEEIKHGILVRTRCNGGNGVRKVALSALGEGVKETR